MLPEGLGPDAGGSGCGSAHRSILETTTTPTSLKARRAGNYNFVIRAQRRTYATRIFSEWEDENNSEDLNYASSLFIMQQREDVVALQLVTALQEIELDDESQAADFSTQR